MAKFKTTGFNELFNDLDGISKRVQKQSGKKITAFQLLTPTFIQSKTNHNDLVSFLAAGGFSASCDDDLRKLDADKLDAYVSMSTEFDTWEDMLVEAQADLIFNPE